MGMGYAQLVVDVKSASDMVVAIKKFLKDHPDEEIWDLINITNNELHATLMYDKRDPDIDPGFNYNTYKATVTGFEKLGNPNGNYYALVLLLECEAIQERFRTLLDKGFEHSFPDLKIHVSLNYGSQTDIAARVLKKMWDQGLFPKTITLGGETWNECKH